MNTNIVKAWKDEAYRLSLSADELAALPMNPAGLLELDDADLAFVAGGGSKNKSGKKKSGSKKKSGGGGGGGCGCPPPPPPCH